MSLLKVHKITTLVTDSQNTAIFLLIFSTTVSKTFATNLIPEIREIIFSRKLEVKQQRKKEIKKKPTKTKTVVL